MSTQQFLSNLARDPAAQLEFARDPAGTARRFGVDEAAIEVLASRDRAKLSAFLGQGRESAMIYSPESAMIYSPESAMIYSPESV